MAVTIRAQIIILHWALVWVVASTLAGANRPCCFRYRNWKNPCRNITCPNNAQCVPAVNSERHYKCMCLNDCWDVGDSEDSRPVCGSDGYTYPSLCHLRRASCHALYKVSVRYRGECDPCASKRCPPTQRCVLDSARNPQCLCNQCTPGHSLQQPVCGTDGRTYADQCTMEYDSCRSGINVVKLSDGQCPHGVYCQAKCPHPHMECRVDSKTKKSVCRCPTDCPPVLSPVCGSDGITYDSLCHLRLRACAENRRVQPVYRGECDQSAWCERHRGRCQYGGICRVRIVKETAVRGSISRWSAREACERPDCLEPFDSNLGRVCGSDGVTYKSECFLRQRAFDLRSGNLTVTSSGNCDPCKGFSCPYYGICGINIRGEVECQCRNNCVYVYKPVCGSDGVTYDLECDLRFQACNQRMDIRVVARGSCPMSKQRLTNHQLASDDPRN